MSPKLRIAISAAQSGPWSMVAGLFAAAGADVFIAAEGVEALALPENWVPDAVVTLPQVYEQARFDALNLDIWNSTQAIEITTRFTLSQLASKAMSAGNGGLIIHVVDRQALIYGGVAGVSALASAGLSRGTALDMRGSVRSNVVATSPDQADVEAFVQLVLHLLSENGKAVSGQIVSITANRVQLFNQPRPVRVAHSDGPWSEESLTQQISEWADDLPRLAQGAKL
ncbi:hypothetical protein [Devosia sp. MC1541]|uniref:hypothetical protein n=1 Tax=Devosia sp. MC1541 TaxID=2725264 RepID=UPI00145D82F3|nr:hypothetical protein [Devosia sp. MC1541]